MTHKEYTSVDYVSQRLRESIVAHLKNKSGGDFPNSYHHNSQNEKGIITYTLLGLEATLTIQRNKQTGEYSMLEIIEKDSQEVFKEESHLKPKRSDKHRISGDYLELFAKERIKNLKKVLESHRK